MDTIHEHDEQQVWFSLIATHSWHTTYTTLTDDIEAKVSVKLAPERVSCSKARKGWGKLQALVYNILPSTTAVFRYAIGSKKLSANQFFVGAQTVVSLLQTTQIKLGMSFIAANTVYTSTNKTTIVWIKKELYYLPGVDASHVYVCALALGCFYSHISTWTFWRALTALLDSCMEIKSAPSVV